MKYTNSFPKKCSGLCWHHLRKNVVIEKSAGKFVLAWWPWFPRAHTRWIEWQNGFTEMGHHDLSPAIIIAVIEQWRKKSSKRESLQMACERTVCAFKHIAKYTFIKHTWLQFRIWLRVACWCVQCYMTSYLKPYILFRWETERARERYRERERPRWRFKIVHIIFGSHKCHI